MREEQSRRETEFSSMLRQRDDELHQIKQTLSQLSPSNFTGLNSASECAAVAGESGDGAVCTRANDLKLKPDTFDGTVPLREFFSQFDIIARANRWDEESKTFALASCLRGRARSVLDSIEDYDHLKFAELRSKLELRFGEGHHFQNYYLQFVNRKQVFGEDFAALGGELERLARLVYPECSFAARDKIACAQFVTALSDNFVKRTLQLEEVTSLSAAVERAKTISLIRSETPFMKKGPNRQTEGDSLNNSAQGSEKKFSNRKAPRFEKSRGVGKECWKCGKSGHFRAECPNIGGNSA